MVLIPGVLAVDLYLHNLYLLSLHDIVATNELELGLQYVASFLAN